MGMPMIYDITRRVSTTTAVFPGDTSYRADPLARIADGASVNVVTLTTTPHVGTHADAYFHYEPDGACAADMPLEQYIGRARVVSVSKTDGALSPADLPPLPERVERLLIRSFASDLDDSIFPAAFPYLSVELIAAVVARGGVLIGVDVPSVDHAESKELPCHHALYRHGIVNLENLLLRGVPDGDYELIALPLKLDGACASPVRAILRPLPEGSAS